MGTQSQHSPTVIAYARSLLELANEQNQAEPINRDLGALAEALESDDSFDHFLRSPSISDTDRLDVLKKAIGGGASPLLGNFLGVLGSHGRLALLPKIADAYDELLGQQLGKIEVDVTVAQKLSPEQLEQVRAKVSQALKKDAVVHQYVDDSIVGGMILRVQDQLIDASVRTQLRAMREQLLAASARPDNNPQPTTSN